MGAVWLAENVALDVPVAIKLIRRELSDDGAAARLQQEARAAARLGHPSIVRVYDFGSTERGEPFIVMEYLGDGESLSAILHRKGRLPAANAVRMLLPVCSALSAAHAKGIIHRDLKPDNIMLVNDEAGVVPKLVDFGIAKLRDDGGGADDGVVGTPDYMSPEQGRGAVAIDARSDIWAVCVVLYETLTGIRPFEAAGLTQHEQPTPVTDFGAGDDRLWAIVATGLEKEPSLRWPSMRELGVALAEWALDSGIETDLAGTAIAAQWLPDDAQAPESPPISRTLADRLSSPEVRVRPRSDPPRASTPPPPPSSSEAAERTSASGPPTK